MVPEARLVVSFSAAVRSDAHVVLDLASESKLGSICDTQRATAVQITLARAFVLLEIRLRQHSEILKQTASWHLLFWPLGG